jgi:hypothetical protein
VDKDVAEAVRWYRLADDQGNATTICRLGENIEHGAEAEQNWYSMQAFGQEYEPADLNDPRPQTRQKRTSIRTCSQDWQVIKRPFLSTADTEFIDSVLEATIDPMLVEHNHDDPERNTSLVSG